MKPQQIILGTVWAGSLAAAFFIGKTTVSPESTAAQQVAAARSSTRSSGAAGGGSASAGLGGTSARSRLEASPLVQKGSSPVQAIADIARGDDPIERANALIALIDTLGPDEFEGVVDAFRELGMTDERRAEYAMLLTAWAKVAPLEALAYADENTGGSFARNTILSTWAGTNPDGALAWANENYDGDGGNPFLVGVIRGLVNNDLDRATEIMETMPRSRERGSAISAITDMLASGDPEVAKEWTQDIEDDELRSSTVAFTAEKIAERDPASAAEWLTDLNDTDATNRVGEDLTEDWYREDPEAAIAWASTLPSETIGEAVEGIADRMVREDPVVAAQWISEIAQANPDANFDGAVGEIIRGSADRDPLLAAEWITGIRDERSRNRYYNRVLGRWQDNDPAAANQWIQSNANSLPESIQRRFLESNDS
ncbi:MAG: hypothetical protein Q7Q71_06180 [Verrucomicrobiota bacterium JB023]|nr:hypothetical protein [Verrucomicrobiota bacterium JB023]